MAELFYYLNYNITKLVMMPRAHSWWVLVALSVVVGGVRAGVEQQYNALCDDIIKHATAAAREFNQRPGSPGTGLGVEELQRRAMAKMALSKQAFEAAVELAPTELQAHANYGQALHNSNQLDLAVSIWDELLELVGPGNEQLRRMFSEKRRQSSFGLHSKARDEAYDGGKGNVTLAYHHAVQQLALVRSPPVLHDMATLLVMRAEGSAELEPAAVARFGDAQKLAVEAWAAGQQSAGRCQAGATLSAVSSLAPAEAEDRAGDSWGADVSISWPNGTTSRTPLLYTERRRFVAKLRSVELAGRDGVIIAPRKTKPCVVYTDTAVHFVSLPDNLPMLTIWLADPKTRQGPVSWYQPQAARPGQPMGPPPQAAEKHAEVASLLQFAATSYYHFVLEVLPRLMLLRPLLLESPELKVLVCDDTSKNQFQYQYLDLIAGLDGQPLRDRLVSYRCGGSSGPRVRAKQLHLPTWDPIEAAGHASHCLPPRSLIRELRETVAGPQLPRQSRRKVVFVTRRGQSMRELETEDELLNSVRAAVPDGFAVTVFDGKLPIPEALALFREAAVVIGVHGGALANILACGEGTLVIELGFAAGFTRHYAATALGLGLDYQLHVLEEDPFERGVSAPTVRLPAASTERIEGAVRDKLDEFRATSDAGGHSEL